MTPSFPEIRLRARNLRPYLAKLLWSLQPVAEPGLGTFAVDEHLRAYYDPQVLKTWALDKCAAVLLHEVLHIFLGHHARARRLNADPKLWNIAGDLEINCILRRDGLAPDPLGTDALYPDKFGFRPDLTAEEFYALLQQEQAAKPKPPPQAQPQPQDGKPNDDKSQGNKPEPGDGKPDDKAQGDPAQGDPADKPNPGAGKCGSCANGHAHSWERPADDPEIPGMSEVSRKLLERAVAEDVKRAAQAGRGSVPAGLVSYVDTILTPQVPWTEVLGTVLRSAIDRAHGYDAQTFARPGRLSGALAQHGGAMFPSWYTPKITVGIVLDTSGSMGTDRVSQALAETQEVAAGAGASVLFTSVDSRAAEIVEVTGTAPIALQGGGGTDMRVGIQAMLDHSQRPDVVVVLTDCDTPWPAEPTPVPLIVVGIDVYSWAKDGIPDWATLVTISSK